MVMCPYRWIRKSRNQASRQTEVGRFRRKSASGTLPAMSCSGPQSSAGSPAITNDIVDSPVAPAASSVSEGSASEGSVGEGAPAAAARRSLPAREHGGREGPDPTRFGDWEKGGRCIDF
jgi:hypothetical protein